MRKLIPLLLCILLLVSGCGQQTKDEPTNPFGTNVYTKYSGPDLDWGFEFIQFQDDGTFVGVHYNWSVNTKSGKRHDTYPLTYGTYSIDGKALTLNISDKSYSCVIKEDHIMVGDTDLYPTDINTYSDDFRNAISGK